jgi:hypothetical protein
MNRFCLASIVFFSPIFGQGIRTEWTREFATPHPCGFSPRGVVDDKDDLWLVCEGIAGRESLGSLLRVDHTGNLLAQAALGVTLPESATGEITNVELAFNRGQIGVLLNLTRSEGRVEYFEGAFFLTLHNDALSVPSRISGPGPQFLELLPYVDRDYLAAGDQEPLTLVRFHADGAIAWRRVLSRKLALPQLAAAVNGDIYVVSQGGSRLAVHRFNSQGVILGTGSIIAKQGSVEVASNENIVVIYSVGGVSNRVYITSLDKSLRRLWTASTPLLGKGGRTYQIMAHSDGLVGIGDAEANGMATLIGLDNSGTIIWRDSVRTRISPPRLLRTQAGFYMISTNLKGFEVTKQAFVPRHGNKGQ